MKKVIIESPYRGNIKEAKKLAEKKGKKVEIRMLKFG